MPYRESSGSDPEIKEPMKLPKYWWLAGIALLMMVYIIGFSNPLVWTIVLLSITSGVATVGFGALMFVFSIDDLDEKKSFFENNVQVIAQRLLIIGGATVAPLQWFCSDNFYMIPWFGLFLAAALSLLSVGGRQALEEHYLAR